MSIMLMSRLQLIYYRRRASALGQVEHPRAARSWPAWQGLAGPLLAHALLMPYGRHTAAACGSAGGLIGTLTG